MEKYMLASRIIARMKAMAKKERGEFFQRFFKTREGEYAEGDQFLGLRVPQVRALAKEYREISLEEVLKLLRSPIHEIRQLALFILVWQFKKGDESKRKKIYDLYFKNKKYVNNWDLVDGSAEHIIGAYLFDRDRSILKTLARSGSLWDRRIAILSCFHFIKKKDFSTALEIASILLKDKEDLIHKAVGWMLREIGERDIRTETSFLKKYYGKMPRTMLRYAIEKFEPGLRQQYLRGEI